MRYDAFISYNHGADLERARVLQDALQRFAKPWYRRRSMRVFRDENNLSASPALFDDVTDALDDSRYYVLLMSRGSRDSEWVGREITYWLTTKCAAWRRIVLVVTEPDGVVSWDVTADGEVPAERDVVNPALKRAFPSPPLYVSLRDVDPATWADKAGRHRRFRRAHNLSVAMIAARIMEAELDAVQGEDAREHRRTLRVAWGAVAALVLLTVASVLGAVVAVRKADEAERQTRVAQSGSIATVSAGLAPTDVALSMATAVAAYDRAPSPLARRALIGAADQDVTAVVGPGPRPASDASGAMALAPDGRLVATTDGAARILVWDTTSGERVATLDEPDAQRVSALGFSDDGRRLVAAYEVPAPRQGAFDDVLRAPTGRSVVWDVERRRRVTQWDAERAPTAVGFRPNRSVVAANDDSGSAVVLRDATTGERVGAVGSTISTDGFAFDATGERVVVTTANTASVVSRAGGEAQIWDVGTGEPIVSLPVGQNVRAAAFSPDGLRVATGDDAGRVVVWEMATRTPIRTWVDARPVTHLDFSPSGALLVSGDDNGDVHVRDVETSDEVADWAEGTAVSGVAFSSTGDVLATGDDRGHVVLRDARRLVDRTATDGAVQDVVASVDGGTVVASTRATAGDGTLRDAVVRWNAADGSRRMPVDGTGAVMALSGDGHRAALADVTPGATGLRADVTVVDLVTGQRWGPLTLSTAMDRVALSDDGSTLLVSGPRDGAWAVEEHAVTSLGGGGGAGRIVADDIEQPVNGLTVGRDGTVVTVDASASTTVWPRAGRPWRALDQPPGVFVMAVALSPDGRGMATIEQHYAVGDDARIRRVRSIVRLRDTVRRGPPVTLGCAGGATPTAVAVSPDRRTVAIGDASHRVTLCDVASDAPLTTWTTSAAVRAVAFDPGGGTLVAGDEAGHLERWDIAPYVQPPADTARAVCRSLRGYTAADDPWRDAVPDDPYAALCAD